MAELKKVETFSSEQVADIVAEVSQNVAFKVRAATVLQIVIDQGDYPQIMIETLKEILQVLIPEEEESDASPD